MIVPWWGRRCLSLLLASCLGAGFAGQQQVPSCTSRSPGSAKLGRASLLFGDEAGAVSLLQAAPSKRLAGSTRSAGKGRGHAFVSLIYGNSSEELVGLRVAMASARRHGSQADQVAITPSGAQGLPPEFRDVLWTDGIKVLEVPPIELPAALQGKSKERSVRWYGVLNKYNVFNLTQYERIVLLDTDVAFSGTLPPDDLFQACGDADLCLVRDRADFWTKMVEREKWPCDNLDGPIFRRQFHCFCDSIGNAGVMVVKPSRALFDAFLEAVARETRPFGMPDQQILSCFVQEHPTLISTGELPRTWNSCHSAWFTAKSAAIVHWCGVQGGIFGVMKPWQCRLGEYCGDLRGEAVQQMWVRELEHVDICTSARHAKGCREDLACHWCSHYCMDRRIACSDSLFSLQPDPEEPQELYRQFPRKATAM